MAERVTRATITNSDFADHKRSAKPMLSAVILAAGYSSRMGLFKPLARVGNATVIEAAIGLFAQAGIDDISVVVGYRGAELQEVVEARGARAVMNSQFELGMFSSVRAGMSALREGVQGCFIHPADIALVQPNTVRALADCFRSREADVVYPVHGDRPGHPTLISNRLFSEILHSPTDTKLSAILARHAERSCEVRVADEAIHIDMDTPEELARVQKLADGKGIDIARLPR